jgi:glycosyltransferase involved in cell wall biosynthesis
MEKHVLRLSQEQRRQGHDVVIAFNNGQESDCNDLKVLRNMNLRALKPQFLRDAVFYTALVAEILFKRPKFEVLHIHGDWSAFWMARLVARLVGASTLIATMHGSLRRKRLLLASLRNYDQVYFTGAREFFEMKKRISADIYWQPSGIDRCFLESACVERKRSDVISVCNLLPVKNVQLILDVAEKLPAFTFRIVGDGPLKDQLESACYKRGITNLEFVGSLDAPQVARSMSESKVFLLTSLLEGTPTVIMEAMACGLPVVTTDANEFSAFLCEGENGYVVADLDVDSLVLKLEHLLGDHALRQSIAVNNRAKADSFEWSNVAALVTSRMIALHE